MGEYNLKNQDKETFTELISFLKKDKDILALLVYGSVLKTENYRDIDVAVVKYPNSLEKPLKYLLQFSKKLDIHFLHEMPLIIAKEAIQGVLVFNKEYSTLFNIFTDIIFKWEKFRPYHKLYLECVQNGL